MKTEPAFFCKGKNPRELYLQLSTMTQRSPVGAAIMSVSLEPQEITNLTEKYLHDFVKFAYCSKQEETKPSEFEVCILSLDI